MPLPHWEEDTPENQARLQTLQAFIRYSSRYQMLCEVDVLQYYEQFLVLSKLMTITGFLTSDEHNTAFWCRFHLDDHRVLQPHSLDTPFHFKDVFMSTQAAFVYKSEPMYMPLPIPNSPPISSPILLAAPPHPSPERPPEILRPASAPPIVQCFNDPDEGGLCPRVNLGSLPVTCHGSRAHKTLPSSLPPSPVLQLPLCLPAPSSSLPVPSPLPQLSTRLSSLLCDSLLVPLVPSPLPVLATFSSPPSHLDSQPLLIPTPPSFPQSPVRSLSLPCDLSPDPPPPPSLTCATSFPPAPSLLLMPASWPLDCVLMAPHNVPPPLAYPPLPLPRPPDPLPAISVEAQSPSSTPKHSSGFRLQPFFDCTPMLPHKHSPLFPPPRTLHTSPIPPLSLPAQPPGPTPVASAEPQPLPPLSALGNLLTVPLRLRPMPTRPPPLPPDASLALLSSPLQLVHATATSPPSPPSLWFASLSQLLSGSRSLPYDPPLLLVVPPPPPPQPPDPMPARTASLQPPPPSPLISSPTKPTHLKSH
jgi:hypothetical protein